jgi:hypothetical protein
MRRTQDTVAVSSSENAAREQPHFSQQELAKKHLQCK